jgi:glycosyltransferase involved in cell wall biosynthesis
VWVAPWATTTFTRIRHSEVNALLRAAAFLKKDDGISDAKKGWNWRSMTDDDGLLQGLEVALDARYLCRPGVGIHRYLEGVIETLVTEGASVTLLVNFPFADYIDSYPNVKWLNFGSRYNILWEQIQLPAVLGHHRFDLYWAPGNGGIPLKRVPSTWKVCTVHDLVPLRLPRLFLWRRPFYAFPYLVWTLAAMYRSDMLLTDSAASADDIWRYFRRKAVPIPPILSTVRPQDGAGEPPNECATPPNFIFYNGGFDARKNVANLIRGFALVAAEDPELQLILTGKPVESILDLIHSLNLQDRVIQTGYVTNYVMNSLMVRAKALVYPSLYEGFGLPILEAFAVGLPVVTARNSALAEVAKDAALFVDPRDPESIALAIRQVQLEEVAVSLRSKGFERLAAYDPVLARRRLVQLLSAGVKDFAPRGVRSVGRSD